MYMQNLFKKKKKKVAKTNSEEVCENMLCFYSNANIAL